MKRDIWIFLFVIGLLFFNWPIMGIFKSSLATSLFIKMPMMEIGRAHV